MTPVRALLSRLIRKKPVNLSIAVAELHYLTPELLLDWNVLGEVLSSGMLL
jgi:hypothetical protein